MQGKVDVPALVPVLEKAGVTKVVYEYWRFMPIIQTTCWLRDDTHCLAVGMAHLNPTDQFCRKTGRMIALRRAVHELDIKHRRNGSAA